MKLESINIDEVIENTRKILDEDPDVSPALKSSIQLLLLLVSLLINRLGLNSKNSSKPPSSDPNRKKKKKGPSNKKPGGQKGHDGKTLKKDPEPDIIKKIKVNRSNLPSGQYKEIGHESRQVIDIDISRVVTEYQVQVLEDAQGKRYTASFPEGVNRPVQYGISVKAHSVYMSQYQLVPYNRVEENFLDQFGMPVSSGSIFNFNEEAHKKLEVFEERVKLKLIRSDLIFAMPMKPALISMARDVGFIVCPMISGHIICPMKSGDLMLWRPWKFFHSSKAYYAMIIGSRTSSLAVSIHCATPTISESWKGPGNKTSKHGQKNFKNFY